MDKSSNSPIARLPAVEGLDGRFNDVIFCGSEGQQHVVFFPGDVQVSTTIFFFSPVYQHRKISKETITEYFLLE